MRPRFTHNLRRLARISFQNIGRNLLLSTATTVMMGLILFIFNVIMVLNALTQSSLEDLGEKIDLIIYIDDDSSYQVNQLITALQDLPNVKEVTFTSSDEALEGFLKEYPEKTDPFTIYGIENPLPANIKIITKDPSQHQSILTYLENSPYENLLLNIESADENQIIAERLSNISSFTKKLIIGVIITFCIGSLLMIMNAIHLSIFTRKREIQIMQLVGARYGMIQFPFLFEGAFYSFIAVFFSFFLLIFFLEGTRLNDYLHFDSLWGPLGLIGAEIGISVGVGALSSLLATHFYLKRSILLENT